MQIIIAKFIDKYELGASLHIFVCRREVHPRLMLAPARWVLAILGERLGLSIIEKAR